MASLNENNWFTEICKESGTAFSLKIKSCLHQEQTPYQHIAVYETEKFGNLLVIDGFTMLSSLENFFYHEMMSHTALFTHPQPKDVAIIGGGDCGVLQEVLKLDEVKTVQQMDIDERVTRLSEHYFPELCENNQDERAKIQFGDGITWMQKVAPASFDVIIVDSTDPVGPAEGLFNEAFYRSCLKALKDSGILIQQGESPIIHMPFIRSMHQAMQSAGFNQTQMIPFPQPIYPSGYWSATMATKHIDVKQFRYEDANNKPFATQYYQAATHQSALMLPAFIKNQL
jgi:spermidine synthase